jgi:hypothetical protein
MFLCFCLNFRQVDRLEKGAGGGHEVGDLSQRRGVNLVPTMRVAFVFDAHKVHVV